MKSKRFGALLGGWILAWAGLAAAAGGAEQWVPFAKSLLQETRDAAKRQVPVLVVFTAPHCGYCERVMVEYLIPMQKDPAYRAKMMLRRVELGSDSKLMGFDGKPITQAEFASDNHVFLAPTVMFFDAKGNPLAKPIVGLLSPDFYAGYLDAAIEESLGKLRQQ